MKCYQDIIFIVNQYAVSLFNTTSEESTLATDTSHLYLEFKKTIKKPYISKTKSSISFTQDVWKAPNFTAFLEVTVHFVDENFYYIRNKIHLNRTKLETRKKKVNNKK